jgi:hypothetical protein
MTDELEGEDRCGDMVKVQYDEQSGRYHATLPADWVRSEEISPGERVYIGESEDQEATGILEPVRNLFG